MKHRAFKSYEARCFPLPAVLLLLLDRERKRFLAFARNDECGEAAFSYRKPSEWEQYSASFQRKEAVRRGGAWLEDFLASPYFLT